MSPKLTYANVMATVAVVLALGGGAALAAGHLAKNSVGARQLKKNSVTGAKVKDQSLTGSDIVASTLGVVPRAESAGDSSTLQGSGPNAFVHGNGVVVGGRRDLDPGTEAPLVELPGFLSMTAKCDAGPKDTVLFKNVSGETMDGSQFINGVTPSFFELENGATGKAIVTVLAVDQIQLATRGATPMIATIHLLMNPSGPKCLTFVQATLVKG